MTAFEKGSPMRKTTVALAALACIAQMMTAAATSGEAPELKQRSVASADGVQIAYTTAGEGDVALLFLHGGFADSSFWKHQFPAFAGEYRVVAVDVAGHGRSGRNRERWTLEAFGEDVRAVVEELGLQRVVVIGNSMGGPIALEAARIMPDRVVAVIGIDTFIDATVATDSEARRAFVQSLKDDFAATCGEMMKSLFHDDADPALVDEVRKLMCKPEMPVPVDCLDAFDGYDLTTAFKECKVPIRSVNGDLYPTNVEGNRTLADYDAVIIEGVGHYPMLERPEEFNRLLSEMVGELVGSGI